MRRLLRKLRALLGNALTWGVGWGLVGIVPGALLVAAFPAARVEALRFVLGSMAIFGIGGAAAGTMFSLILQVVYGRRHLHDLRAGRVGLWAMGGSMLLTAGALWFVSAAGALIPPAFVLATVLTSGVLGWGSAAGATKIAQKSDRSSLGPGPEDDVAELLGDDGAR